jgi:hypothetical protein
VKSFTRHDVENLLRRNIDRRLQLITTASSNLDRSGSRPHRELFSRGNTLPHFSVDRLERDDERSSSAKKADEMGIRRVGRNTSDSPQHRISVHPFWGPKNG